MATVRCYFNFVLNADDKLYSPNMFRVIQLRRMMWVWHVAHMRGRTMRETYVYWSINMNIREKLHEFSVDGG
jgi:hypothetical protein